MDPVSESYLENKMGETLIEETLSNFCSMYNNYEKIRHLSIKQLHKSVKMFHPDWIFNFHQIRIMKVIIMNLRSGFPKQLELLICLDFWCVIIVQF
jgi:hypothetical protein